MIYADNAATTRLADEALEAMLPWLRDEYANPSQPYSFSRKAKKALSDARENIASCIGAQPEEIYFTSGGTESDNWAIKGSIYACDDHNKSLITSAFEHHAVLNAAESLRRFQYPVQYIPPNSDGMVCASALASGLSGEIGLISVMMANNELGTIQPICKLAEIAHTHGAIFHTDAVQAVGHIPVDVNALGVDLLSASAHKFNGPKGVGFLFIRKGTKILPHENGGSQEQGLRAGTENIAGIIGMAEALRLNSKNLNENREYVHKLELQLLRGLEGAGVSYQRNGTSPFLPGLLSLSFPDFDGEAILHRMDLLGIAIATGSACDSVNTQISHVLQAIGLDNRFAKGTIRISLWKNNSSKEVDSIVAALKKIVKKH